MNPIVFSNQKHTKKSALINLAVLFLIFLASFFDKRVRDGFAYAFSNLSNLQDFILTVLLSAIFVGVVFFVFLHTKNNKDFTVDDEGVVVGKKKYPWSDIKNYHLLGDSQSERIGLVTPKRTGGFDLLNPYYGMNIYVLVTKTGFLNNSVRLQVSEERIAEFEQILASHNLQRETKLHMYLTGVSPLFILFFLVPFALFAFVLLAGVFLSK